jgi:hypothetical protein
MKSCFLIDLENSSQIYEKVPKVSKLHALVYSNGAEFV